MKKGAITFIFSTTLISTAFADLPTNFLRFSCNESKHGKFIISGYASSYADNSTDLSVDNNLLYIGATKEPLLDSNFTVSAVSPGELTFTVENSKHVNYTYDLDILSSGTASLQLDRVVKSKDVDSKPIHDTSCKILNGCMYLSTTLSNLQSSLAEAQTKYDAKVITRAKNLNRAIKADNILASEDAHDIIYYETHPTDCNTTSYDDYNSNPGNDEESSPTKYYKRTSKEETAQDCEPDGDGGETCSNYNYWYVTVTSCKTDSGKVSKYLSQEELTKELVKIYKKYLADPTIDPALKPLRTEITSYTTSIANDTALETNNCGTSP